VLTDKGIIRSPDGTIRFVEGRHFPKGEEEQALAEAIRTSSRGRRCDGLADGGVVKLSG